MTKCKRTARLFRLKQQNTSNDKSQENKINNKPRLTNSKANNQLSVHAPASMDNRCNEL